MRSRRFEMMKVPSLRCWDSYHVVGGFLFEFELFRTASSDREAQTRQRNHPRHREVATSRVDDRTPRAYLLEGKIPIIIAARFSGVAEKAGWSNAVASKIRRAQGAFARPRRFVE